MGSKANRLETERAAHRRAIHSNWCARHPEIAAQERAIRKSQREIESRWSHKWHGTPATHESAARGAREGALARLYMSGALSIDDIGSAEEIRAAAQRLGADVAIRTMSMETRVDQSRDGQSSFFEALGAVRREMAYRRWREACGAQTAAIEALVINDIGLVQASRQFRIGPRKLRGLLIAALEAWPGIIGQVSKLVDRDALNALHQGLV